jgi:hypothetical protein
MIDEAREIIETPGRPLTKYHVVFSRHLTPQCRSPSISAFPYYCSKIFSIFSQVYEKARWTDIILAVNSPKPLFPARDDARPRHMISVTVMNNDHGYTSKGLGCQIVLGG